MQLSDWMTANHVDDQAMADRVATDDVKCDRTMISRYRRRIRRPEWPVIARIREVTGGQVTADDYENIATEAAE